MFCLKPLSAHLISTSARPKIWNDIGVQQARSQSEFRQITSYNFSTTQHTHLFNTHTMGAAALVIDVVLVFCLAIFLLHRYGDWKKQHIVVTLAAFISWYFPFMIIFVLPLDVSNTCYRQCIKDITAIIDTTTEVVNISRITNTSQLVIRAWEHTSIIPEANISLSPFPVNENACVRPWSYIPQSLLIKFWHVVYWSSQALTWLILPIMQSYANAGDFTVVGKMKSALIENAIYYGTYMLIFGVCLIYIVIEPAINMSWAQLKVLAITASNTWGLFLLVLLLGYGLVDVPRSCWNNSKRGQKLQCIYFKIAKLSVEKTETEENLEDVMEDVKKSAETIRYNNQLRKCVDTILLKCPESIRSKVQRNRDDFEDYNNPTETPTEKSLVRLHKQVIKTSQTYQRTQCQWQMAMDKACSLEDIAKNENNPGRTFVKSVDTCDTSSLMAMCHNASLEWYWKCLLRPWCLRVLALFLGIFATMVVWSECLFFVEYPPLSLFALFIGLAKQNYDYLMIEFVCFITIAFLSWCAYYTIFKIRILNYYYLAAPHQTTENSLIFCGMLLCRLTPPLCLNFLGLIHLDNHVTKDSNLVETTYTQIMGHMDVIPFISDGFNIYFPIMIVLLCIATYFRLGTRLLHCVGFQQFIGEDDLTQELVDEGREHVKRERRRRQRIEDGENRRRNWSERSNSSQLVCRPSNENQKRVAGGGRSFRITSDDDQTELLRNAEAIDYTGKGVDSVTEFTTQNQSVAMDNIGSYQTQSHGNSLKTYGIRTGPPRGIFDDI